jgi:hypothetical protein
VGQKAGASSLFWAPFLPLHVATLQRGGRVLCPPTHVAVVQTRHSAHPTPTTSACPLTLTCFRNKSGFFHGQKKNFRQLIDPINSPTHRLSSMSKGGYDDVHARIVLSFQVSCSFPPAPLTLLQTPYEHHLLTSGGYGCPPPVSLHVQAAGCVGFHQGSISAGLYT